MNLTVNIPDDLKKAAEKIADLRTQIVEFLTLKDARNAGSKKQSVSQVFDEIDRIREKGFTLGKVSVQDAIAFGRC